MSLKLVRASAVTAVGWSIGECSENESTTHRNQWTAGWSEGQVPFPGTHTSTSEPRILTLERSFAPLVRHLTPAEAGRRSPLYTGR